MKRCLWLLLLAALLVGCGKNVEPDTIPTTTVEETTVPPETSCYVEGSEAEKSSGGALKVYDLPDESYTWMHTNGETLLLQSAAEQGKFLQGIGEGTGFILDEGYYPDLTERPYRQATSAGIVFYDPETGNATFLRPGFQEFSVELGALEGEPVFTPDGNSLFYCVGNEIWAMDLNTGIKRMLKSQTCQAQSIESLCFDGSVLACKLILEDGKETLAFVDAATGQTLAQESEISNLYTWQDRYILDQQDGTVKQCLFGQRDGTIKRLYLPESQNIMPILAWNSVLCYHSDQQGNVSFELYDLESGTLCASTQLKGTLKSICTPKTGKSLWILAEDPEAGEDVLYQWLPELSPATSNRVFTGPYYTAESPDVESLEHYKEIAKELGDDHGVKVFLWDDAVQNPGEYELVGEYQNLAVADGLIALDKTLKTYPQEFLYKLANRYLNICLVRSISTGTDSVHYLLDGDFYIVLRIGADFDTAFAQALGYLVDIHVLGNTSAFDDWDGLNPEGFNYGQTPAEELLTGDTRAFADEDCMASVTNDRSRTFYYAMCAGNETVFESEVMQAKLTKLCQGIRAAWKWKKVTDVFPWEQYLKVPVAPA